MPASVAGGLRAQQPGERILAFHSDITVNANSSMAVRETIAVNATGSRIRHGIYRDFPPTTATAGETAWSWILTFSR